MLKTGLARPSQLWRSFAPVVGQGQGQIRYTSLPPWRPATVLDEYDASVPANNTNTAPANDPSLRWVQREARPISLRQLTFFGRTLTEARLLSSANYVRTELPVRIAHRLRDMQSLPYAVITNSHLSHVYELYYKAFESFHKFPDIRSVEDNDRYCEVLKDMLKEHLTVIPRLQMGVLEIQGLVEPDETDKFMTTLLRSRISRRVIAQQHLALTDTFHSPWHFPNAKNIIEGPEDLVGEVLLHCNAKEIVEKCANTITALMQTTYGHARLPEVRLLGHLGASFPYIPSILEYIIGELLRNSIQATVEQRRRSESPPPPIEVTICEADHHVIIRISDQGGGVCRDILPYLWSFSKGPRKQMRLDNLNKVPRMAATMQELSVSSETVNGTNSSDDAGAEPGGEHSLSTLTSRPPDLRLGMGLPISKIYAEYWAGSLELHSLEGYGVDAFLQIPKLGNKNEQLRTRASMDAV